jgi:hypothetical protein
LEPRSATKRQELRKSAARVCVGAQVRSHMHARYGLSWCERGARCGNGCEMGNGVFDHAPRAPSCVPRSELRDQPPSAGAGHARRQPFVIVNVVENRVRRCVYEASAFEVTSHCDHVRTSARFSRWDAPGGPERRRKRPLPFAEFRGYGVSFRRRVFVVLRQLLAVLRNARVAT